MQIQCNKLNNVYFMVTLDLRKISCCDLYCKRPLY